MPGNRKHKAFTLVEIIVIVLIFASLIAVTFIAINPLQRLSDSQDEQRREEASAILQAIKLYSIDHKGELPIPEEAELPEVTTNTIMEKGFSASDLEGLRPNYLKAIPTGPENKGYKVGLSPNGSLLVGARLNNGSTHIAIE